jgi:hypothetical protein
VVVGCRQCADGGDSRCRKLGSNAVPSGGGTFQIILLKHLRGDLRVPQLPTGVVCDGRQWSKWHTLHHRPSLGTYLLFIDFSWHIVVRACTNPSGPGSAWSPLHDRSLDSGQTNHHPVSVSARAMNCGCIRRHRRSERRGKGEMKMRRGSRNS